MNKPGIKKIENSHAVQVYASTRSIWRGNMWSSIHVNIKLDKSFLLNNNAPGGRFILRAYLEKSSSKGSCITDDSVYFKSWFNLSRRANQRYLLVTLDPYNTLDVEIHKELFSSGDVFRVIVIAEDRLDGATEAIFGASQTIAVTDLSLSIEHRFLDSPYCDFVEQDVFAWYSKCGGEQSSLSALVHLKDANNNVPKLVDGLELLTELVYEDGSPTPLKPICPLKDRKSGQISNKPLFRMCAKPRILPGESCASFSFRIEEVTFHHSGHHGFKLKISPADSLPLIIHPATSSEILVVLSKPKSGIRKREIHQSDALSATQIKKRKVSVSAKEDRQPMYEVPISLLITGYRVNGKCLSCMRNISIEKFLERGEHTGSCAFATLVVPTALGYYYKQEGAPFPAVTIRSESPCMSLPTRALAASASNSIPIPPPDDVMPIIHPLPHTWGGGYEAKSNPSSGGYEATRESSNADFTRRENMCPSFTLQDTEEVNERYSMQTHVFPDKARTEMYKTRHLLPPRVYSSFKAQGDESCIFTSNEKSIERNLVPYCSGNTLTIDTDDCSEVTLEDTMCMEENEKYLLQEFPVASDGVHTSYTNRLVPETYKVEKSNENTSCTNRLVQDTFQVEKTSENTSCTNRLVQETFQVKETDEKILAQLMDTFSSTSESCSEENNSMISSSSNMNSYKKGGIGHEFIDLDSVSMNTVDESYSLYEPIALSVENLNDSNSTFNTTTSESKNLSGSPLVEIALGENTELNFYPSSDRNSSQQPYKSSNPSTKEVNRSPLSIYHPGQLMCFDNGLFSSPKNYPMNSISHMRHL